MPSASFAPDLSVPPLLQNFAGSHIEGDHATANGDNIEDSASLGLPITGDFLENRIVRNTSTHVVGCPRDIERGVFFERLSRKIKPDREVLPPRRLSPRPRPQPNHGDAAGPVG